MKVLYAALRNDPRDLDRSSSVDYGFYTAMRDSGHEVCIVGPFPARPPLVERAVKKVHDAVFRKRYLKWDFASVWRTSQAVNQKAAEWQPDVVFTMFPATITFYKGQAPAVFNTDLTFYSWQENGANFSRPALWMLNWIEGRAIGNSRRVILHSEWSKRDVMARHGTAAEKIRIMPMPAAIPVEAIPAEIDVAAEKRLIPGKPLRLLLVGKEFHRKGVDIAIETVAWLNEEGIAAELTVCATRGPAAPHLTYAGPYRKSDPAELQQYMALYRQAHLLLHPARFEPAGIVPGEAAAFATPTITNDAGALATTVKDNVSGVVLPKHSPAEAYVRVITELVNNPERYYALCESSRRRYEEELNWKAAGKTLDGVLREAVAET
jgi:glycosyltransferase involved in cell wall biosynthesis